jgi:hypothetical protein
MKTGQKYVFYPYGAHILSQLDITVMYTLFWSFKKYRISAQNPKVLAFGFTDNHHVMTKLAQNQYFIPVRSIFLLG